jgi:hypothetical protein
MGFSHVKVVVLSGYQFNDMNGRQRNWLTKIPSSELFFFFDNKGRNWVLLKCQFQILLLSFEKLSFSWKLLNRIFAFF